MPVGVTVGGSFGWALSLGACQWVWAWWPLGWSSAMPVGDAEVVSVTVAVGVRVGVGLGVAIWRGDLVAAARQRPHQIAKGGCHVAAGLVWWLASP